MGRRVGTLTAGGGPWVTLLNHPQGVLCMWLCLVQQGADIGSVFKSQGEHGVRGFVSRLPDAEHSSYQEVFSAMSAS